MTAQVAFFTSTCYSLFLINARWWFSVILVHCPVSVCILVCQSCFTYPSTSPYLKTHILTVSFSISFNSHHTSSVWHCRGHCYNCLTSFTRLVWLKLYLLLTLAESKWNSSSAHWTFCDKCWPDDLSLWKPLLEWKVMPKCKLVRAHRGYRGTHHLFLHGHESPACAECEATVCSWVQSVACQATDQKLRGQSQLQMVHFHF